MFNNLRLFIVAVLFFGVVSGVSAQTLKPGQMAINSIPMKNIIQGKEGIEQVIFKENSSERFVFYSRTNEFWIHVLGQPYSESRQKAEQNFLSELGVSKNESCFLDVSVMVPVLTYRRGGVGLTASDVPPASPYALPFCEGVQRVNMNDDTTINGADFSQCLADYESLDEDLPCDFNVNRRIDATDLSLILQYMNEAVPAQPQY